MSSPSVPVSSLRSHLLAALQGIPGSRVLHIHVLVSTPRKPGQSLFLHATTRPKCFVQDIIVLLSEETAETGALLIDSSHTESDAAADPAPRTFVSAIEASVYAFPASSSTVLYISKVDGTGQGAHPSPTSTLLHAFLAFYASPHSPLYTSPTAPRHLWVHLFARSQRQYLFPNSADHPAKKPLGDVALCKWWKRVLTNVAKAVETAEDVTAIDMPASDVGPRGTAPSIRLYYILPGQTENEASYLLREAQGSSTPPRAQWIYSHPYNLPAETGIPFPSGTTSELRAEPSKIPLANLIPHFEDDPKSRFLDELAATSEEQTVAIPTPTPRKKRQKIGEGDGDVNSTLGYEELRNEGQDCSSSIKKDENEDGRAGEGTTSSFGQAPTAPTIMYIPPSSSPPQAGVPSPPSRPSTPEPIISLRDTTLSPHTPHLPTFPTSLLSPHTPPPNLHGPSRTPGLQTPTPRVFPRTPQTPRTPRRPKSDLDTISPVEFWERMSFRQECALGAVTGFFVAIFSRTPQSGHADILFPSSNTSLDGEHSSATIDTPSTLLSGGTIPHSVLKRVMSSLLTGVEFSTAERSHKGTNVMESAIKGLCQGLNEENSNHGGVGGSRAADVGANGEAPDTSRNIYASHIYASLSTTNPPLVRKSDNGVGVTAAVNVLGVRRKKRE